MIVQGISIIDLKLAAKRASVAIQHVEPVGKILKFHLKPIGSRDPSTGTRRYQRRGPSGRRANGVCIHGHMAIIRELAALTSERKPVHVAAARKTIDHIADQPCDCPRRNA